MPCEARPQARSRKGLLGPMVSSRSLGPEPCTSTTAGKGPLPVGQGQRAGQGPFAAADRHLHLVEGAAVDVSRRGGRYAGVGVAWGTNCSPLIGPAVLKTTRGIQGGLFKLAGHVNDAVALRRFGARPGLRW